MIRIKKETANVWEQTNGNIANVDLWKPLFTIGICARN